MADKKENEKGKTRQEEAAKIALMPSIKSMATIQQYSPSFGTLDITEMYGTLKDSVEKIRNNDLSEVEAHLIHQAQALDTMFHYLAQKAHSQEYMNNLKTFMTLALRAQNQSRMTLETLALVKNPQPFIRQQNVAQQQIVNNGSPHAHAEKNVKSTNELLEDKSHDLTRMDPGAPPTAGGNDKELAAVEALDGRKNH